MPTTTPLVKVNNTKDYGANVVLHGEVFDDAAELAAQLAEEQGLTYVHPFNDLTLATGQEMCIRDSPHPGHRLRPLQRQPHD